MGMISGATSIEHFNDSVLYAQQKDCVWKSLLAATPLIISCKPKLKVVDIFYKVFLLQELICYVSLIAERIGKTEEAGAGAAALIKSEGTL